MIDIVTLNNLDEPLGDSIAAGGVISIGNFDGVHRGHVQLLREVKRQADGKRCPAIAVTLFPHPAVLLRPEKAPTRLTSIEQRARRMHSIGIDQLVVCTTTQDLLTKTAEEFFLRLVVEILGARAVVEGPNFFFGKNRGGDITTLGELCRQNRVGMTVVDALAQGEEMVSSTRIRDRLLRGNVHGAQKLLGRSHEIQGVVEAGDGRGRQIGFPTANLGQIEVLVPAAGVYAGWAAVEGSIIKQPAAIHVGESPTFESGTPRTVEAHLMDYDADLYGKKLAVEFVDRVRDVKRFESADQLTEQLTRDIQRVRTILRKNHS